MNYWYEKCQTTYGSMKICNCELDHCNGHRLCKTLISNKTVEIPVTSTCLSAIYSDSKTIVCRACHCIYNQFRDNVPYASDTGILLHIYGKLTTTKLKSSRLSYSCFVSLSPASIFNEISKYEAEVV
jgi:hypothetical protein